MAPVLGTGYREFESPQLDHQRSFTWSLVIDNLRFYGPLLKWYHASLTRKNRGFDSLTGYYAGVYA